MSSSSVDLLKVVLFELDVAILLTLLGLTGIATLVLGKQEWGDPRPFFLGDATLWYEWNRGSQTAPISYVFVAGYIGLASLVFVGERHIALVRRKTSARRAFRTALRFALGVWTASMFSVCLTEFGKSYVGRLRPNYADRCFGAGSLPTDVGTDGLLANSIVSNALCVNGGKDTWDGRRSFPSGHAALGSGLGVYAQLWFARFGEGLDGLPVYLVSMCGFSSISAGLWVGASRIVDNAHHTSDVVGGMFLGAWLAACHFWMVERETGRVEAKEAQERRQEKRIHSE